MHLRKIELKAGSILANLKIRPSAAAVVVAAVLGAAIGWVGTSPRYSMGINWDTAGYFADIGGRGEWAVHPWNSHYAAWQVYWLAAHLSTALGGTLLDGARGLNGLSLALSASVLTACGLRWGLSVAVSIILSGLYLCSWGTLLLVFTWEDNILVHPWAIGALAVSVFQAGRWRRRDSLLTGALAGIASLMSWQGASFALPAMYAAIFLGGSGQSRSLRFLHAALIPVTLAATRATWVLLYWLTATRLSATTLLRIAFEPPSPNYLPANISGWWTLLTRWSEVLKHLGIGLTHEAAPSIRDASWIVPYLPYLGALFLIAVLLTWGLVNVILRARFSPSFKFLSSAFLLLTLTSAVYLDLPEDKYKRYDYIPMFLSLGVAALVSSRQQRSPGRKVKLGAVACLMAILGGQGFLACQSNRRWYYELPASLPGNYLGHGSQTWFAYFRQLRQSHQDACSFVFAFDEVKNGRYQLEIPAALRSELPQAIVLGAPPEAAHWPRPLPLGTGRLPPECAWVSAEARKHVSHLPDGAAP